MFTAKTEEEVLMTRLGSGEIVTSSYFSCRCLAQLIIFSALTILLLVSSLSIRYYYRVLRQELVSALKTSVQQKTNQDYDTQKAYFLSSCAVNML